MNRIFTVELTDKRTNKVIDVQQITEHELKVLQRHHKDWLSVKVISED